MRATSTSHRTATFLRFACALAVLLTAACWRASSLGESARDGLAHRNTVRTARTALTMSAPPARDFPCRLHDCCCANLGHCKLDCSCFPSASRRADSTRDRAARAARWSAALASGSKARVPTSHGAELDSDGCHGARPPAIACASGGGGSARAESTREIERSARDVAVTAACRGERAPENRRLEPPTPPPRRAI